MKISPLLAALGGGAVGLGLSQGGMGGGAAALSPMLALLMHKKKGQGTPTGPEKGPPVAPPPGAVTPPTGVAPPAQGMDPAKRQQLAQMFLSMGGQFGGFRPQGS